ncbi:MAG: FixH family protein [Verrucomicrobia bacterium]|nr:FixH family protein [Verrucomicrobiota bacterium]
MNTSAVPARNLWPYAIICWFVIFASALAAWTCFAMRQKTDLVGIDYYEQEVRFQRQLDRLNRTAAFRGEVLLQHDASLHEITLQLPAGHLSPPPVGQIHFYRPSNAGLDVNVPLVLDAAGHQRLGTSALRGGLWKVRVQWKQAGAEYFFEQLIVVDESSAGLTALPAAGAN